MVAGRCIASVAPMLHCFVGTDSANINWGLDMIRSFVEWKSIFLDLLAPPECAGCGVLGIPYCAGCLAETRLLKFLACPTCGELVRVRGKCSACRLFPPSFAAVSSFALYAPPFRKVVVALKYQGDVSLGHYISGVVFRSLEAQRWPVDLGVPVPLGAARRKKRGYNQVNLFASPLCRRLGIPCEPNALARIQETRSQVGLSSQERRYNLRKAFQADSERVTGKNVLLFDDVFTSGATANECSTALLEAGAKSVFVFTLARAASPIDRAN